MMLGREVRQPVDLVFNIPPSSPEENEPNAYVRDLRKRMCRIHSIARENIGSTQTQQKNYFDRNIRHLPFNEGDLVYKLIKSFKVGQSRKLQPTWQGPLLVTKVLSPILYQVQGRKKSQVLHHDLLKRCEDREIPLWLRRALNRLFGEGKFVPNAHVPLEQPNQICQGDKSSNHQGPTDTQTYTTRSGRVVKQPRRFRDQ